MPPCLPRQPNGSSGPLDATPGTPGVFVSARQSFAALRHSGYRAQFVTYFLAMMADVDGMADRIERLAVIDIVPTLDMYERTDMRFWVRGTSVPSARPGPPRRAIGAISGTR